MKELALKTDYTEGSCRNAWALVNNKLKLIRAGKAILDTGKGSDRASTTPGTARKRKVAHDKVAVHEDNDDDDDGTNDTPSKPPKRARNQTTDGNGLAKKDEGLKAPLKLPVKWPRPLMKTVKKRGSILGDDDDSSSIENEKTSVKAKPARKTKAMAYAVADDADDEGTEDQADLIKEEPVFSEESEF